MVATAVALVALSFLLVPGTLVPTEARAQDFPYMVPQAPEFDQTGRTMESGPGRESQSRVRPAMPAPPSMGAGTSDYQQPRQQVAPQSPPTRSGPRAAPQAPNFGRSPAPSAPVASTPPQPQGWTSPGPPPPGPPSPQMGPRPDCTQFPMLIAQARSEEEMRNVARHYLTCLMQNGWDMETAKKQVISVIETAYTYMR